jgi:acyl dehydratase
VPRHKVRFSGMVRPGDMLTCRGTVLVTDEQARTVHIAVRAEREASKPLTTGQAVLAFTAGE